MAVARCARPGRGGDVGSLAAPAVAGGLAKMASLERVVTKKRVTQPDEPRRYRLSRPVEERIAAVEELRREHHGWEHGTEPRVAG